MWVFPRYARYFVNYQPFKERAFAPDWKFILWGVASLIHRSWMASIFFDCMSAACNGISRLLPIAFIRAINGLAFSYARQ